MVFVVLINWFCFYLHLIQSANEGLIIHVSAENSKFLQIADELGIMKQTRSGVMKSINISCLDEFFLNETMDIDDILTRADKQIIIKYTLDSIRANEYERYLPGYKLVQLYHGQSIIAACYAEGLIIDYYPLRDTAKFCYDHLCMNYKMYFIIVCIIISYT